MKKYLIIILMFCTISLEINAKSGLNKLNFIKSFKRNLINNWPKNFSSEEVLEKLEDEEIQFVMFSFVDILGNLKEVITPIDKVKNVFDYGLTFDSSSVVGYANIENSDMIIKPDLSTLRILPWTDNIHKTAWFMCDVYKEPNLLYESDSRYILKKVLSEIEQLGYQFNVGLELEFFLFSNSSDYKPIDNNGYFDVETLYLRQQEGHILIHALNSAGIDVEKFHHEVAPGQYEISINYANALSIADQVIAMKYVIQMLANQLGYKVNFNAKPLYGKNGSGMHIHYSLYDIKNKQNAFYSFDNQYNISDLAEQFLAGNIKYIKDFTAILNPTINSYKRLVKDFEAPVYNFWGIKNRSALFRLPLLHQNIEKSMRFEIRSPDPSANPYLAFASLLKTGLQGIKEKLTLEQPINVNVFSLSENKLKDFNIKKLPKSLSKALKCFEKSLLAKELFTKAGLDIYLNLKKKEIGNFNKFITNFEFN